MVIEKCDGTVRWDLEWKAVSKGIRCEVGCKGKKSSIKINYRKNAFFAAAADDNDSSPVYCKTILLANFPEFWVFAFKDSIQLVVLIIPIIIQLFLAYFRDHFTRYKPSKQLSEVKSSRDVQSKTGTQFLEMAVVNLSLISNSLVNFTFKWFELWSLIWMNYILVKRKTTIVDKWINDPSLFVRFPFFRLFMRDRIKWNQVNFIIKLF